MLEVTLIILNILLICILVGGFFLLYKFYKSYGKNLMGNLQDFSKMSEQLKNQQKMFPKGQNPLEQINDLMKMFKK